VSQVPVFVPVLSFLAPEGLSCLRVRLASRIFVEPWCIVFAMVLSNVMSLVRYARPIAARVILVFPLTLAVSAGLCLVSFVIFSLLAAFLYV
jgi:hypothetical protein